MLMALISLYLGGRGREGWGPAQGTHQCRLQGRAVPSPQCSWGHPRHPDQPQGLGTHWAVRPLGRFFQPLVMVL